jgi:predicted RNA-binding Zn-ribbon protein involved in translation (DUF1610 family)
LLADMLASGKSNEHLRSYLKKVAVETWDYVNWLTHNKNAVRPDADIALKVVENLLWAFIAARRRLRWMVDFRCPECGSYRVVGGTCEHCDWVNPEYVPPDTSKKKKRTRIRPPAS